MHPSGSCLLAGVGLPDHVRIGPGLCAPRRAARGAPLLRPGLGAAPSPGRRGRGSGLLSAPFPGHRPLPQVQLLPEGWQPCSRWVLGPGLTCCPWGGSPMTWHLHGLCTPPPTPPDAEHPPNSVPTR